MTTIELRIEGMSCGHCVAAVKKALESVEGLDVTSVEVGRASGVTDDPAAITAKILDAIDDAGYSADIVTA